MTKQRGGLMPPEVAAQLPKLYANEGKPPAEAVAVAKLFDPTGRLTLFCTEYDGEDTVFGYMVSPMGADCDEWGYSSISELESVKVGFGLRIERDIHWRPTPMWKALPDTFACGHCRGEGHRQDGTSCSDCSGLGWRP
jgi:hypothetical protein